jgi:hypothetical protein
MEDSPIINTYKANIDRIEELSSSEKEYALSIIKLWVNHKLKTFLKKGDRQCDLIEIRASLWILKNQHKNKIPELSNLLHQIEEDMNLEIDDYQKGNLKR